MNLPDPDLCQEVVDGQLVRVPTARGWVRLHEDAIMDEVGVYLPEDMVHYSLDLAAKHIGLFMVVLYRTGPRANLEPYSTAASWR